MAAKDTDIAGEHGRVKVRDLGDGTMAPLAVAANADGTSVDLANPLPVEQVSTESPSPIAFTSSEFGNAFHLANGAFGGTKVDVWNGEDSLWTLTEEVGSSLSTPSDEEADTPPTAAKWTNPNVGNILQWQHPSSTQDLTGYVAVSFAVFVQANYAPGDKWVVYGWDGAALVGVEIDLRTVIDVNNVGSWQTAIFLLSDMQLEGLTVQSFRIRVVAKDVSAPTVFFDTIAIQQTFGAVSFRVAVPATAPAGTVFSMDRIIAIAVSDSVTTQADGTVPAVDPLEFMGRPPLPNGVVFSVFTNGVARPLPLGPVHDMVGMWALFFEGPRPSPYSRNGNTGMVMALNLPRPIVIQGDPALNYFEIEVRDDLRGFTVLHFISDGGLRLL